METNLPGLDQHFSNGNIAFLFGIQSTTVRVIGNVLFNGEKMKLKDFLKTAPKDRQIVVTKDDDGMFFAQFRPEYERDYFDAFIAVADSLGVGRAPVRLMTTNGKDYKLHSVQRRPDGSDAVVAQPGAWAKLEAMSTEEKWNAIEKYRKLRRQKLKDAEKMAKEEQEKALKQERMEKVEKKIEKNKKKNEKKKMAKLGNKKATTESGKEDVAKEEENLSEQVGKLEI